MHNHPGYELVKKGLSDISQGKSTIHSALLFSARTRLESVGVILAGVTPVDSSMDLYRLLYLEFGDGAHSRFNALNRRLVSFIKSMERELNYA